MGEFNHVILTVFNVRVHYGGGVAPDLDWLAHRFDLFDKFCYPSVRAQTNLNFKWLVFFDSGTPAAYRDKIAGYAAWENFVPQFVDHTMSVEAFAEMKRELITRNALEAQYLISTTLDNDDAIGKEYIASVQRQFARQDFEFINFTRGYALNKKNNKLYRKNDPANPFISLIERIENFKTVWFAAHTEAPKMGQMRQVETKPIWLQVIHGRNVLNTIGRRRRVPFRLLEEDFALNYSCGVGPESAGTIFFDNVATKLGLRSRND